MHLCTNSIKRIVVLPLYSQLKVGYLSGQSLNLFWIYTVTNLVLTLLLYIAVQLLKVTFDT